MLPHIYGNIMTANDGFTILPLFDFWSKNSNDRKDNLMKHYLSKFGSSLMALALTGVISLTALAGARPFHLVEHGQLQVTPRDASGTVLDVVANGVGTA